MKKFFTLFTFVFICASMFGQKKYVDLVVNGHMEEEQAEDWSCFWVHEFRTMDEQFQGFANIVEDPQDPKNHCAHVFVRSEAQADEAGNKIKPDGSEDLASWDSQFFIYVSEKIESGKMLKLTMRVKADKNCSIETQAHNAPGDYNHYQLFGNIDVTTEWTKIEKEVIVNTSQTQEENGKEMHTVAFNLATMKDGANFWFDDIKLEIKDQADPSDFKGWFNMLRVTDLDNEHINDLVINGQYSYYTGRDGADGVDRPARIVIDPLDGKPAFNVTSIAADSIVKTINEETGEESVSAYWINLTTDPETGEVKGSNLDDWQSQFFVSQPHPLQLNQQVRFVMWARAEKPAQIDSQIHANPGSYLHWQFLNSFDLTTEWQKFEVETTINASEQVGGFTVAFNINKLKDVENNYYFRIEEFSINEADVTDRDRTIGEESITLPVPAGEEPQTVMIDMTKAMETLGISDLKTLITSDKIMKALDEEEIFMEEGINPVYDGVTLNTKGIYDENGTVTIEVDDNESADNKAAFVISNLGEALSEAFDSKLCFEKDGWYYVFNIRFVNAADYDDGIAEFTAPAKNNGAIYDLSGRRVKNVTKGIYIQNGKTFVK